MRTLLFAILLAGTPHSLSAARADRADILRNFKHRDLHVVHHSVARDARNSCVDPHASPSRDESCEASRLTPGFAVADSDIDRNERLSLLLISDRDDQTSMRWGVRRDTTDPALRDSWHRVPPPSVDASDAEKPPLVLPIEPWLPDRRGIGVKVQITW